MYTAVAVSAFRSSLTGINKHHPLNSQVNEELNKLMSSEGLGAVTTAPHARGCTVRGAAASVRLLLTTLHQNLRKLEPEVGR